MEPQPIKLSQTALNARSSNRLRRRTRQDHAQPWHQQLKYGLETLKCTCPWSQLLKWYRQGTPTTVVNFVRFY